MMMSSVFSRAGKIPPAMGRADFLSTKPTRGGVMSDGCDRRFLLVNHALLVRVQTIARDRARVVRRRGIESARPRAGNPEPAARRRNSGSARRGPGSRPVLESSSRSRKPESIRSSVAPSVKPAAAQTRSCALPIRSTTIVDGIGGACKRLAAECETASAQAHSRLVTTVDFN